MARKQTRAEPAPTAEVEAVSKPGMGIDEGIVLMTTFMIGVAIWLVVMANQQYTG